AEDSRETFALALHALVAERVDQAELDQLQEQLLIRYDRAFREHKDLHLADSNVKGRSAVGAITLLGDRSARRIEEPIKKAPVDQGYDRKLVDLACQRVREQLIEEARKR